MNPFLAMGFAIVAYFLGLVMGAIAMRELILSYVKRELIRIDQEKQKAQVEALGRKDV